MAAHTGAWIPTSVYTRALRASENPAPWLDRLWTSLGWLRPREGRTCIVGALLVLLSLGTRGRSERMPALLVVVPLLLGASARERPPS